MSADRSPRCPVPVPVPVLVLFLFLFRNIPAWSPLARGILAGRALALALSASTVLLSACGGGAAGDATGGIDSGLDPSMPSPVETFVGVWDLSGPLNGLPGDEALLVIRPVDGSGESQVLIYELDDRENCYLLATRNGKAFPDPAFRRDVFLDRVASFDRGVLNASGNTLVIDYFDTFDVDGDGDRDEQLAFSASSVAVSETDLETQLCN